jgi:type I restriction enzyme, S subunit
MSISTAPLEQLITDAQSGFPSGERSLGGTVQLRMNNVTIDGNLDWKSILRVPASQEQLNKYRLLSGDIVFNSTNSPKLVGKTAMFKDYSEPVVFSNHFIRLRVDSNRLDSQYLTRWLNVQWRQRVFEGLCTQWVNQASVRKEDLLSLEVPLIPLSEQQRIATILEKADRLRRQQCYALQLSDSFLQSMFLKMFGDPVANPMGWEVDRLSNHIELTGGYAFKSEDFVNKGVPLIRIGTINQGFFDSLNLVYLPESFLENHKKFIVYPGDVLITLTGTVGKDDYGNVCPLPDTFNRYFLNQRVAKISITQESLTSSYLHHAFKDPGVKKILTKADRGIRQANLSNNDILDLLIPLPPISLRKKFDCIVQQFGHLRIQKREAERQAEHLFQTLLHHAFRGELTERRPATVIAFPRHNSVDDRGAILSYIVNSQWQQPTFGHVKCAKFVYWASAYIGIDLGGEQWREAAGPLADFFYSLEETAKEKGWVKLQERGSGGYSYSPGPDISERVQAAIEILGERKQKLDKLLEDLAGVKSDQIEAAATLFAAWNDFLIDGHQPTDDEIIREALENWHPDKKLKRLFNPLMLKAMLQWMRAIKLTPRGIGPRTIKKI